VLCLDYYSLKKRVENGLSADAGEGEVPATFVELGPPSPIGSAECIVETEDARGSKMRVHLKGDHFPDVIALCRCFWNVEA
jgi:hypothetical protein